MKKDCLCYENPSGVCMGCFNKALQEQAKEIFKEIEKLKCGEVSFLDWLQTKKQYQKIKQSLIGEVHKKCDVNHVELR